jgi:hypothetical protein
MVEGYQRDERGIAGPAPSGKVDSLWAMLTVKH